MQNGSAVSVEGEPFPGALYTCALAVYCLEDSMAAARQVKLAFGKSYRADWNTLCRAAGSALKSSGLNGDLLAECAAHIFLRALSQNKDSVPLKKIFVLLQTCEFGWDGESKGQKPSLYLAQLLDYTCTNDELESAYRVLGLTSSATMQQIKSAHRKLAAKCHPDAEKKMTFSSDKKNDAESSSASSFLRIQAAYELICKSRSY